jgi:membrane protein
MEKKRVEYIKMMYNRKEKNRGFIEKYKDSIGTIASLCAVVAFITTVITALIQFWNSYQAAEFYHINQFYFIQESVGNIFYDAIAKMFQVFFPIIAFNLLYRKTKEIQTHQNNKFMLRMLRCVFFFVYIIISSDTFSIEAGDILVQLKIKLVSNVFLFLYVTFCFLLGFFLLISKLDLKAGIHKGDVDLCIIWSILFMVFFGLMTIKYELAAENIQGDMARDISISLFSIYYYVIFMLSKYGEKINIIFLICWQVILLYCQVILSIALIIIMVGPYVMLLRTVLDLKTGNPYFNIKKYEIVQNLNNFNPNNMLDIIVSGSDIENNGQNRVSDSNLQVVILHIGSQVLLMNGTVNDGGVEIKNPKHTTSSSNLYLDISSYEIQDANKYIFYGRRFASVKRKYGDYLLDKDDEEKK